MRIAVTAASGQLGQLVIAQLLERTEAKNIVALARQPEKLADLATQGIEVRPFDYNQTAAQLAEQLKDIDKLLLISSSEIGQRVIQHQHVIDAAQLAQIKLIVYTSLLKADTSTLVLAQEHVVTEQYLKASLQPYTILRNNWYSENYAMGLADAVEHGKIFGATHHAKIASASRLDYATAAAVVLMQAGHDNKTYELAGDQYYTLDDVASWASGFSHKPVIYTDLSELEYQALLIKEGLPETFAAVLANSDQGASQGDLYSDSLDLSRLIGRATTAMQDTIRTFLLPS
ncbi:MULTISPECIES: SDR family oxidoreductase [unclassified Acinetobacter]|uniref:SDR family oxidoreductase n=1 Tax=unclassified Acinetobacter TaxID=196816 RepID=UPI0029344BD2|nr:MULTISPECIES: SDR family oxidoreductase [unclassified Acinetobacter]WOE33151.1 SDR family oxidoreductase [Acinetobacter sp. SAAs470]WOE38864.1 SDR family oxidoreductase [Acinetobacter sp. SAAs474]